MPVSPAGRASGTDSARAAMVDQLSRADRVARGKDARAVAPLESHAEFAPAGSRDPVGLLLGQAESRVPELVPVRHGRMLVSAFTFYRGAALPMAADLATTPASGLRVQLCGDAHLSNFGAFASPERRLVFDVNDFDETLPGPFEWDVKRLAASLAVAGRDNGFPAKARRKIVLAAAESYRTAMRGFAEQPLLDVWYAHLDIEQAIGQFRSQMKAKRFKAGREAAGQGAHQRQHEGAGQAHHRGRRAAADHQRPADDRPGRGGLRRRAGRRDLRADPRRAGQVPAHPAVRPAAPAGAVHAGPGGPQGRRGRQRRHPRLDPADGRPGRGRAVVPAGQGGPAVGAGGVLRAQPVHQPGRAGRRRAAPDAGRKRHLPRLDPRPGPGQGGPRLLRPPAEGLEILRPDRADDPLGHEGLRRPVRVDPGPGARPLR